MKRCRPPSSRTTSGPGLRKRWYVLASTIWAPAVRRSSGPRAFTVACVPTGMKIGVSTTPCAVVSRPARAAPSVATTSNFMVVRAEAVLPPRRALQSGIVRAEAVLPPRRALQSGIVRAMRRASQDQHRVAVGVEAIAGADRVAVRLHDQLAPGERRDQRQEGRARQMEVRQERVHHPKPVARGDEDPRGPVERTHAAVRPGGALERPRRCGAD